MKIKSFKQFLNEFEIEGENNYKKLSELETVLKVAEGYGENVSHHKVNNREYVFVEFFDTISLSDRDVDELYDELNDMNNNKIISTTPLKMDIATDNNTYLQAAKERFLSMDWNDPEAGSNILVIPIRVE